MQQLGAGGGQIWWRPRVSGRRHAARRRARLALRAWAHDLRSVVPTKSRGVVAAIPAPLHLHIHGWGTHTATGCLQHFLPTATGQRSYPHCLPIHGAFACLKRA